VALDEFALIARHFAREVSRADVLLGVGDDAALLMPPPGAALVATTDTLISGVHFPTETDPESIGHKALAVNLSDLAAMGATPAWALLSLTLPEADESWLAAFARGFFALSERHHMALVGGDTTRGALSITVQALGHVAPHNALRRGAAQAGDLIYVTGTLGDAGLALLALQDEVKLPRADRDQVLARLNRPEPRIAAGQALAGIARACIDVSDGLAADLGHILTASGVGAQVQIERLPRSAALARHFDAAGGWVVPLAGGDDYELCFTVPSARQAEAELALAAISVPFTWIGHITARSGLHCLLDDGSEFHPPAGYRHF
jgi:thiamine-monophosphate kinase